MRIVQVGIIGTAVVEILIGLLIMRIGKAALDKVLPPDHHRQRGDRDRYGAGGFGAQHARSTNWGIAIVTLLVTVMFSVYLQGKGLLGMLPILLGAIVGYMRGAAAGQSQLRRGQPRPRGFEVPAHHLPGLRAIPMPGPWSSASR